jgi:aspartate dehydrogenase
MRNGTETSNDFNYANREHSRMKISLIGLGAIGSFVAEKIKADKTLDLVAIFDSDENKLLKFNKKIAFSSFEKFMKVKAELVVEAASAEAVKKLAPQILKKNDLLIMSVAAMADAGFEKKINAIAKKHGTRLFIPSGAIIGIDGIMAVKDLLEEVEIETRKPPRGFGRDDLKETVLFEGSARQGVPLFPQNVNVAATLSLAGIGFDRTKLRIVSDPAAKANQHTIKAKGSFGEFFIQVKAAPSKNPKTSSLAAMSAFAKIKEIQNYTKK